MSDCADHRNEERSLENPVDALATMLGELALLIGCFTDEQYATAQTSGFSSGVGSHVRHCLDHVDALLAARRTGSDVDYDARIRGTPEETCRESGLRRLDRVRSDLDAIRGGIDGECNVRTRLDAESSPTVLRSSWARETVYVLQHTTHHAAFMSAMAKSLGIAVPEEIGRAASTRRDDRSRACAR